MRQVTLASQGSFERYGKKTRREKFLEEMDGVMPWPELESLIAPHYPKEGNGRHPVGLSIMLRHLLSPALVQPVGPGCGRVVV